MSEGTIFQWPQSNGKPMALVSATIKETIPTAQYANVQISGTVTRFTKMELEAEALDATYEICDKVIQKKHDEILKELEK